MYPPKKSQCEKNVKMSKIKVFLHNSMCWLSCNTAHPQKVTFYLRSFYLLLFPLQWVCKVVMHGGILFIEQKATEWNIPGTKLLAPWKPQESKTFFFPCPNIILKRFSSPAIPLEWLHACLATLPSTKSKRSIDTRTGK